jgi:hypothetical protein
VHSTLRGPSIARAAVASARRQAKLNPALTMMQLDASVVLAQAVGVSERAAGDWCAVVLRDGRWASCVQHSAAAGVAAPSRGRC